MNARARLRHAARCIVARALRGKVRQQIDRPGLAILMFHKINARPDELNLTLQPEWFTRVLEEIGAVGPVLDLADAQLAEKVQSHPGISFAITFDDGYLDNRQNAWPRLQEKNMPATIFLSVDHISGRRVFWYERLAFLTATLPVGRYDLEPWQLGTVEVPATASRLALRRLLDHAMKELSDATREDCLSHLEKSVGSVAPAAHYSPMLSWEDVRAMTGSIRFGSHTVSHCLLSRESPQRVRDELRQSRKIIEQYTGQETTLFAYPNGRPEDYSPAVVQELRDSGYRLAVTTTSAIARDFSMPYELPRVNVYDGMCTDNAGRFHPDLFWSKVCRPL